MWHWSEGTFVRDLVSTPQEPVRAAEPVVLAAVSDYHDAYDAFSRSEDDLVQRPARVRSLASARRQAVYEGYPLEAVKVAALVLVAWSERS